MYEQDRQAGANACRLALAIATVPMQRFEQLYAVPDALARGTLFRQLDLPFCPGEVPHEP